MFVQFILCVDCWWATGWVQQHRAQGREKWGTCTQKTGFRKRCSGRSMHWAAHGEARRKNRTQAGCVTVSATVIRVCLCDSNGCEPAAAPDSSHLMWLTSVLCFQTQDLLKSRLSHDYSSQSLFFLTIHYGMGKWLWSGFTEREDPWSTEWLKVNARNREKIVYPSHSCLTSQFRFSNLSLICSWPTGNITFSAGIENCPNPDRTQQRKIYLMPQQEICLDIIAWLSSMVYSGSCPIKGQNRILFSQVHL